ncbi:MAG: DUF6350 family protein, partial [bacterium]
SCMIGVKDGGVVVVHTRSRVRHAWLAAALAAAWALVAGFALAGLPGVAVWLSEGAADPVAQPARLAAAVWLAAHRVGLDIDGAAIQLAPGGLSLLIVLLVYQSARWAVHSADVREVSRALTVIEVIACAHAVAGGVVAAAVSTDQLSVAPLPAAVWTGSIAGAAAAFGALREAGLLGPLARRLPSWLRTAVQAGLVAVAAVIAGGAALVAASAVAGSERVGAAAAALDPDLPGTIVLAAASAALVPNAVVWAASFSLGPGFTVGSGTSVSPAGVEVGQVPAIPVLGALPTGDLGWVAWVVLAMPVVAGVLAGAVVRRRTADATVWQVARCAGCAAATAATVMAALALLSGGAAGAERLSAVGPTPWQVALATFVLIALPALAAAWVRRWSPGTSR